MNKETTFPIYINNKLLAFGQPIDTEIGTLIFTHNGKAWQVINKTQGSVTECGRLEVLVQMMKDQIELEYQAKRIGLHTAVQAMRKGWR
jgi:hypothetical protein